MGGHRGRRQLGFTVYALRFSSRYRLYRFVRGRSLGPILRRGYRTAVRYTHAVRFYSCVMHCSVARTCIPSRPTSRIYVLLYTYCTVYGRYAYGRDPTGLGKPEVTQHGRNTCK